MLRPFEASNLCFFANFSRRAPLSLSPIVVFVSAHTEASGKRLNCSTLLHRQHPQTNSQAHLNIASSISPPPPLPTHPPLTTPTTTHHNYKDDENSHIQALHPDRSGACLRDKCSKQTSSTLDSAIPSCSSSPCIQAQQRKQASPWHPQANMASVCRAPC